MEKPEQAKARKLYQDSGGQMLLKDIAAQLGVAEGTLRSWKNRYAWDGKSATLQTSATQRKRHAATNRKAAEEITANEELKDHEKDFCAAFVHAPSASQAALLTGRYSTYGAARTAACEMMKNPAVRAEITRLKEAKRAMLMADGDDVIELYMRIAFADIHSLVTLSAGSASLKPAEQIDGQLIAEVKNREFGLDIKLADKMEALKRLDKFFLLNPMDKHKQEYDNRKLELEAQKQKTAAGGGYDNQDDGFMDAMKAVAQEVWEDEGNSGDVPV